MLTALAIENYRSLLSVVAPLDRLNVITGANGSGKSNLYRALRLLANTARGDLVGSLANEGGLGATLWAGPESLTPAMKRGEVRIQGGPRKNPVRLRLGFADENFGYSISLGFPPPSDSAFHLDPEIKSEVIWAGPSYRPSTALVERTGSVVKLREGRSWDVVYSDLNRFESLFTEVSDPERAPEVLTLRDSIRQWRFYDHFRTDRHAPARAPQLGTRTPVLAHDGRDLAAALQTIFEIGDYEALNETVADAFPGAEVTVTAHLDRRFEVTFSQDGLLRPLSAAELSDGTLRFLLWTAALLTPRPPPLMVLNEPETSLHPDLLPALARLIVRASERTQVWIVTHAPVFIDHLLAGPGALHLPLEKELGETTVAGLDLLARPPWAWPD